MIPYKLTQDGQALAGRPVLGLVATINLIRVRNHNTPSTEEVTR